MWFWNWVEAGRILRHVMENRFFALKNLLLALELWPLKVLWLKAGPEHVIGK